MLNLKIDPKVLSACVRRAVDAWIAKTGKKASVSSQGDAIEVTIFGPDPVGEGARTYRFASGTNLIKVDEVKVGNASDGDAHREIEKMNPELAILIQEELSDSDGLLVGSTDPLG